MKLPDILKSKSYLSEEKIHTFYEEYDFLEEKLTKLNSAIMSKCDIFNTYMVQLHGYIEFLLEHDIVHQTKRRNLFTLDMQQFFSDRSTKEKKSKVSNQGHREKRKDYDTERKIESNNLKRTNTAKMLSPKIRRKNK